MAKYNFNYDKGERDKEEEVHDNFIVQNISSFWEANSESETDSSEENMDHESSKLSYQSVKQKINKQYDTNIVHKYSTVLDVFTRYIQCYQVLYSEASYYCNWKLNMIMLPCMFLSTSCSVMSPFKFKRIRETLLFSILNGFITFLLAIVNYLKLDANAEAHKISAYQYAKLKSQIEFNSGEVLLHENDPYLSSNRHVKHLLKQWEKQYASSYENKIIYEKEKGEKYEEYMSVKKDKENKFVSKVETIMIGIKESLKNIEDNNHFTLPKHIVEKYATIYNMNIFLYIKRIDTYKNILVHQLRNVKNEIRFYSEKMNKYQKNIQQNMQQNTQQNMQQNDNILAMKDRCKILYTQKNNILRELFELNKGYTMIDSMLQQELINIDIYTRYWYLFYFQNILNCLFSCFGKTPYYVLPKRYKVATRVGFEDDEGNFLLEKVLNT